MVAWPPMPIWGDVPCVALLVGVEMDGRGGWRGGKMKWIDVREQWCARRLCVGGL